MALLISWALCPSQTCRICYESLVDTIPPPGQRCPPKPPLVETHTQTKKGGAAPVSDFLFAFQRPIRALRAAVCCGHNLWTLQTGRFPNSQAMGPTTKATRSAKALKKGTPAAKSPAQPTQKRRPQKTARLEYVVCPGVCHKDPRDMASHVNKLKAYHGSLPGSLARI